MAQDLPVATIVDFIIGDFERAWDALASTPGSINRGNFLFARQAMILLEVACRLCFSDKTGQALKDLSQQLEQRDSRYFTELPGTCWSAGSQPEFFLPSMGPNPATELIAALFDLIRNGQAHQYQQIRAQLSDGKDFEFGLTGAEYGLLLSRTFAAGRPSEHLKAQKEPNGDLWMKIRTDVLFLDIRDAVHAAGLLNGALTFDYLSRPRAKSPHYQFSATDLETLFQSGGHY